MKRVFQKILDLYSNPKKWAQGNFARNINGESESVYSIHAQCFCLHGAIKRVCSEEHANETNITNIVALEINPSRATSTLDYGRIIHRWNDAETTRFEDVILLVTKLRDKFQ